mmetsp:Transcript_13155/g.18842  ORF Transcript_13155/g.18842 Transcript_13155/m.18842 type:complete len:210 (+) Transcript_13155:1432-2061(+)
MKSTPVNFQMLSLTNHFFHSSVSHFGHDLANFFGHQEEVVHHVLWLACKLLPQFFILSGNSDRTCIQVTLSHHDTSHRNQRPSSKAKFFCTQKTRNDDITTSLELTVGLEFDSVAQSVENEGLLCFCKAEFPRKSSAFQSSPCGSTGSSVMTTDSDMISNSLGNSSSYNSHTDLGNQFHGNFSSWLGILQIMDKLRQIFDRVNIMMGWR